MAYARDTSTDDLELDETAIDELKYKLRGPLLQPGDNDYEVSRRVYNAMIDKHPGLIARCVDAADVMTSVDFARDHNMLLAVRGGGHNVAGLGTCNGGLVIDLSHMRGVRVDPENQTVRVEGGCTLGDMDHATHAFGLATPGGIVSTTGVGGLTLGGGFGYLTRRFGLSCDNLVSADVVTADGRFVRASEKQNEDLFWGLRGGGGNFGAVTSFEFKLHPVSQIYGGLIFYPLEKTEEIMRFYWEFIQEAPLEMNAFFGFHILPPAPFIPANLQGMHTAMMGVCYTGPMENAEEAVKPLREITPPLIDMLQPMPYPTLQQTFDQLLVPGLQHYWKADFINDITDELIGVQTEFTSKIPHYLSGMHLYPINGAVHNMSNTQTAFSYRDANFSMVIAAIGPDPANMPEYIKWAKDYWSAVHPYSAGAANVNFLMEEGQDRIKSTYRENYDHLAQLKKKWDPNNLFRVNQNIKPAEDSE